MKNVPNIITCLNLLSGCMACVMVLKFGSYTGGFIFIALAAVFDFMDGLTARILKAYSRIGAELDSLADVISFGLAPGYIAYTYLDSVVDLVSFPALPFIAFLIPIFSAIRLAKFNVDTRQTNHFLGLPVPANALFWSSFIPSLSLFSFDKPIFPIILILILLILFCLLMVSEIPMFALKFKNYNWKDNKWAYSLLLFSILILIIFYNIGATLMGVSIIIILFIIMSLIKNTFFKS